MRVVFYFTIIKTELISDLKMLLVAHFLSSFLDTKIDAYEVNTNLNLKYKKKSLFVEEKISENYLSGKNHIRFSIQNDFNILK
jgi:hypothetical protein